MTAASVLGSVSALLMAPRSKALTPIVAPELAIFPALGEGDTPTKAGAALRHARADKRVEVLRKIPGGAPSAWARFVVDRLCDVDPAVRVAAMDWLCSRRTDLTLAEESAALERLDALRAILTPDERRPLLLLLRAWEVAPRGADLAWLAPMLDDPEAHGDARGAIGALARRDDGALGVLIDSAAGAPAWALPLGLDAMPLDRLRALSGPLLARRAGLTPREALPLLRALTPLAAELGPLKDALRSLADADPSIAPDALIALASAYPDAVPDLPARFDAWLADGEYGRQSFACALAVRRYPRWMLDRAGASPRFLLSLSDDEIASLGPDVAAPLRALAREDIYDARAPRLLARVLGEGAVEALIDLIRPLATGRFESHRRHADWRRVTECAAALGGFGPRARGAAPLLLAIGRHNDADSTLDVQLALMRAIAATGGDPGVDAWLEEIRARGAASRTEGAAHGALVAVALLDAQRGPSHLDARWPEVEAVLRDPFGLYRRWGYEALAPYVDQARVREALARAMAGDPAPENQRCCAALLRR